MPARSAISSRDDRKSSLAPRGNYPTNDAAVDPRLIAQADDCRIDIWSEGVNAAPQRRRQATAPILVVNDLRPEIIDRHANGGGIVSHYDHEPIGFRRQYRGGMAYQGLALERLYELLRAKSTRASCRQQDAGDHCDGRGEG
jgi:hypothetical protein